jgi:hypothetical protein
MDATQVPPDVWLRRCEARLRELRPSLVDKEAEIVARLAFGTGSDLDPEEAAAVYAEILDAGVPVADLKRWMRGASTDWAR